MTQRAALFLQSSGTRKQVPAADSLGSVEAFTKSINQTTHGFAVGDAIYFNGSSYVKAKADASTTLGLFLVSTVTDADNFILTQSGFISGLSGLTSGEYHFVSAATAGELTTTEPSDFSNPILFAVSVTEGFVLPFRPSIISTITDTFTVRIHSVEPTDETTPGAGSIGDFDTLDFDPDADEEVKIQFTVPDNINSSGNLDIKMKFAMKTANTGSFVITTEGNVENTTAITLASSTFNPSDSADVFEVVIIKSLTGLSSGEEVVLKIKRDADDGSDTHTGDLQSLAFFYQYSS